MIDPLVPVGDGHRELSEDDRQGLLPSYIATRGDLFDAEQRNILVALLRRRAPAPSQLLDDKYLRDLHRAMFGDVWAWAGQYRTTQTSIGIDPRQITTAVRLLVDDARAWVEHESFPPDDLAVRFHHRLVAIHPFPNGNGRHGRVAANYLIEGLGQHHFSWGANLDVTTEELRSAYLRAIQQADGGDTSQLLAFARS